MDKEPIEPTDSDQPQYQLRNRTTTDTARRQSTSRLYRRPLQTPSTTLPQTTGLFRRSQTYITNFYLK